MTAIATHFFRAALLWLRGNPLLTALVVYSLVFSIAALTAAYLVCRINSNCPTARGHGIFYLVQSALGDTLPTNS